jgi:hypothetical protein
MKYYIAFFIVLLASCHSGDKSAKPPVVDHSHDVSQIVFGWYCGECHRPYSNGYKLTPFGLYVDDTDSFYTEGKHFKHFASTPLDSDNFILAKGLFADVNPYLLSPANEVHECPECNDGTGLYLEIKTPVRTYSYKTSNQDIYKYPDSLKSFLIKVNRVIRQIDRSEVGSRVN